MGVEAFIRHAAMKSELHEFIDDLPEGAAAVVVVDTDTEIICELYGEITALRSIQVLARSAAVIAEMVKLGSMLENDVRDDDGARNWRPLGDDQC